jgi:radical SAM protein with 4Fe4S-binding SPASM domain
MEMNSDILHAIDIFVANTKEVIYLRQDDYLLIIRPDRIQHLNRTGFDMLHSLYEKKAGAAETVDFISSMYGTDKSTIVKDLTEIIKSLSAIMNDDYKFASKISVIDYNPDSIKYPVLSEIAITYRCQNRCDFCYASSPYRGDDFKEITADQIKLIIDKIHDEAKVPTISFTGGEPTLRNDLPELIEYAVKKGMRTNLITNGVRSSDKELVKRFSDAGLHSAQVSLESHDELIHNRITGNTSAYKNTVTAIHNLKEAGIHTHTNTTICRWNRDHLIPLVKFVKDEFDAKYLSMNMIIATGIAKDNENVNIGYSSISSIIEPVIKYSEETGIRFVWYSPTPYCMFNPVDHNLGSKSCACVSGLLSVNPAGDVLPCSSYTKGIGNLLKSSFTSIWNSDEALYFREKRYIPPVCRKCSMKILCKGACPLYWENAGSFREIELVNKKRPLIGNFLWSLENRLRVNTRGVAGVETSGEV